MNLALNEVLKHLDLKPGKSRCVVVDDYEIAIRRSEPAEDGTGPMLNIWLDVPESVHAKTIVLQRGEPEFPKPIEITETDLAPE
jgi:hypothetical protein